MYKRKNDVDKSQMTKKIDTYIKFFNIIFLIKYFLIAFVYIS